MKKIIFISIIFMLGNNLFAQSIDSIINQITKNNPGLKAMLISYTADSVVNRTGIYLPNPDVGFNYLFGSPSAMGNRKDFSIMQTFDFPTAYKYKNQISGLKNEQLQYVLQKEFKAIVLKTRLICIDLVYYNLLIKEYSKRFKHAKKIASSYKTKFDLGDISILEYNKARLNRLNAGKDLERLNIEKKVILNELTGLNGNIPLKFDDTVFYEMQIPEDFEQWYDRAVKRNPVLSQIKLEGEMAQKQQSLNLAMSLPKFSTGYMSEFTAGENFQGISFGISVPLWENKNKVEFAKLKTKALQEYEIAGKLQYYNSLKSLYTKAVSLQETVNEYEINLQTLNNAELLYKALEKGEIGLIDYILELSFYYDSYQNLLDMKREMYKTSAELNQY